MTKTTFYRGLPLLLACQLKTTAATPVPVDISLYQQIAVYARCGSNAAVAMTVQVVAPLEGTFSALIADTLPLKPGDYQMQVDYLDASGVHQSSTIGSFTLVSSVRYG